MTSLNRDGELLTSKNMKNQNGSVLEALLTIIGTLVALTLLVLPFLAIRYSTTRGGEHSGYVTAVEQTGLIFHNYTIYFKTDNSSSQEDTYCVHESKKVLADLLREANKNRQQVTIHYEGVRGFGISLCQGEEIVEIIK